MAYHPPRDAMAPEAIKALRDDLRETQQGMADRVGVDISAYQRWEAGDRRPRGPALKILGQLADLVAARAAERKADAPKAARKPGKAAPAKAPKAAPKARKAPGRKAD